MSRFDDQANLHELSQVVIESGRLCADQAGQLFGSKWPGGDQTIDDLQSSLRDQTAELLPLQHPIGFAS